MKPKLITWQYVSSQHECYHIGTVSIAQNIIFSVKLTPGKGLEWEAMDINVFGMRQLYFDGITIGRISQWDTIRQHYFPSIEEAKAFFQAAFNDMAFGFFDSEDEKDTHIHYEAMFKNHPASAEALILISKLNRLLEIIQPNSNEK